MAPTPDQLIAGRFRILNIVATGGMGRIYRAQDTATGGVVAVKQLVLRDSESVARFERESTMLANIRHPGVVGYVAHGHSDHDSYLVMNWVDGENLMARASKVGLTTAEAVNLGVEIGHALGALHQQGLVHRDVKPANIMVPFGAVSPAMLVDLGLVRDLEPVASLTRTGTTIGSPSYMSPEQAMGLRALTAATDVYSLACTLYLALTGTKPFPGEFGAAVEAKILVTRPAPPRQHNPELPEALSELIARGLSRDPGQRPQDGHAFAELLAALPPVTSTRKVKYSPPPPPRASPAPRPVPELFLERTRTVTPTGLYFVVAVGPGQAPLQLDGEVLEALQHVRTEYGVNDARMRDGTLVLVSRPGGQRASGAEAAAGCALALSSAVAGHSAVLTIAVDSGERAIERAMQLLAAEEMALQVLGGDPLGVRVDDETARHLGEAFVLKDEGGKKYLVGLKGA